MYRPIPERLDLNLQLRYRSVPLRLSLSAFSILLSSSLPSFHGLHSVHARAIVGKKACTAPVQATAFLYAHLAGSPPFSMYVVDQMLVCKPELKAHPSHILRFVASAFLQQCFMAVNGRVTRSTLLISHSAR